LLCEYAEKLFDLANDDDADSRRFSCDADGALKLDFRSRPFFATPNSFDFL
jgi:hypothetical protein